MAKLPIYNQQGKSVGEVQILDEIVSIAPNPQVIHDYIVMIRNNQRTWSASTKGRSEVSGSGAKPWRQKGTGRARAGSLASPLFRGGGVTFGPKPKKVKTILPKKVKQLAFKTAIAEKIKEEKFIVIDELQLEQPKTKKMAEILRNLKVDGKILIVITNSNKNIVLSVRNIPNLTLRRADNINAFDLLYNKWVIMTKESLASLKLTG